MNQLPLILVLFLYSKVQRVKTGSWSWGVHWLSYFTITCSVADPEAMSGCWAQRNFQPGGERGLPIQAPSPCWWVFSGNPDCPLVWKMGRPCSHLNDVLFMLHCTPGLRFGISIPSIPGGFLSPWKSDVLKPGSQVWISPRDVLEGPFSCLEWLASLKQDTGRGRSWRNIVEAKVVGHEDDLHSSPVDGNDSNTITLFNIDWGLITCQALC